MLCIEDSGPGIDPALRERLYQPFSAGSSRSGSGLGLCIAQEIVKALQGDIQLRNRTEGARVVGLTARVQIPLADTHF